MLAMPRRLLPVFAVLLALAGPGAFAATTDCAVNWSNFAGTPGLAQTGSWASGFVTNYTKAGQAIRDQESGGGAGDTTAGANPTNSSDLASGSPGSFPGPYSTTDFGYYDGTTPWNPNDPSTLADDFIMFRWRLAGDPAESNGSVPGLANNKYNVLLDIDGDGYKEFWILVDGNTDRVYLYYQDLNRQDINTTIPYQLPSEFLALSQSIGDTESCASPTGTSRLASHTRSYPAGDGTGDYFLEVQIPMSAFDDMNGNQVLFPDSPVAYVYSTGESNTNPLQKDFMQRLQVGTLNLANPIFFGDIVTPSGIPTITFTDLAGTSADYYLVGGNSYVQVLDRRANADPSQPDSVTVAVSDPLTGDDELLTLWETGSSTGVFTNAGGFCTAVQSPAAPPAAVQGWLLDVAGTGSVGTGDFVLAYNGSNWTFTFTPQGGTAQSLGSVTASVPWSGAGVQFTLRQDAPVVGTTLTFCSKAADSLRLTTTAAPGAQNDAYPAPPASAVALSQLRVVGGEALRVTYTSASAVTVTDTSLVLASGGCGGTAIIGFTRADGTPATSYNINSTTSSIDSLFVTVVSLDANTDRTTAQQIQVRLFSSDAAGNQVVSGDEQTITLTETGPDTNVFRNTTGLPTRVALASGPIDNNGVWEDFDGGVITAVYTRADCPGSVYSATAAIAVTPGGGDVAFTNASGTLFFDTYTAGDSIYVTLQDVNLAPIGSCSGSLPPSVTLTARDSAGTLHDQLTVTLAETASGSYVWRNTVAVATAVWVQGSNTAALDAANGDTITVSYTDCNDGDNYAGNDVKIDTARFNAPDLVINRVLFAPSTAALACQTEAVEIYNSTNTTIPLAGYQLTDGDPAPSGFTYTFPDSVAGAPLQLAPGERAVVSLSGTYADFLASSIPGVFYLFMPGSSPSAYLDDADQLTLYKPVVTSAGTTMTPVDFVSWSNTSANAIDWISDDSAAVAAGIWGDNQYRSALVGTDFLEAGRSMSRLIDGYDRNLPSDWTFATQTDSTCLTIEQQLAATRVTLLGLRSDPAGRIEFRTGSQRGTAGFNVWACTDATGSGKRLLTPEPIAATGGDTLAPVQYEAEIERFEEPFVLLQEIEKGGSTRWMGPFPVGDEPLARALDQPLDEAQRARSLRGLHVRPTPPAKMAKLRDVAPAGPPRPLAMICIDGPGLRGSVGAQGRDSAVRIETAAAGTVTVAAADLQAAGLATPFRSLEQLQLTSLGHQVPFRVLPGGSGITFVAEELQTDYSKTNVYQLSAPGVAVPRSIVPLTRSGPPVEPGMQRVERDLYYSSFVPVGASLWTWDFAADGLTPSLLFDLPGLVPATGSVPVRVHVTSSSTHLHLVEARINGVSIGTAQFQGARPAAVDGSIDGSLLRESGNVLEVVYSSEPNDGWGYVYVDAVDLGVSLRPSSAPVPARVSPWTPDPATLGGVQYLIVAPAEFAEAAQRLASAKTEEGLRARFVATEQAYSRYSAGVTEPNAIRELIRDAGRQLRYVMLLGDDTLDPLDHTGLGSRTLVPSLYAHQDEYGYMASENLYADRDGDGLPDVAIGRLPASTPAEADTLVDKVLRQAELLAAAAGHQTFAADNAGAGDFDFIGRAREVARTVPASVPVTWAAVGVQSIAEARGSLQAGLSQGGLVHYFGHGSDEVWADERLLDTAAVAGQADSGRGSVVFTWTCNAQWYVLPFGPTVNEALMLVPNGGALAAFGPVSVTRPAFQRDLSSRVYEELRQGRTLGEAIRRAKVATLSAVPLAQPVVEGFNLLGDPALRLP